MHSRSAEPSKTGVAMMEGAERVAGRSSAGVAEGPASIRWAPGTTDQPLDAGPHDAGWLPHGPRRYVLSSYSNVTRVQSRISLRNSQTDSRGSVAITPVVLCGGGKRVPEAKCRLCA